MGGGGGSLPFSMTRRTVKNHFMYFSNIFGFKPPVFSFFMEMIIVLNSVADPVGVDTDPNLTLKKHRSRYIP